MKYCLQQPGQLQDPPLRLLTPQQVVDHLWTGGRSAVGVRAVKTMAAAMGAAQVGLRHMEPLLLHRRLPAPPASAGGVGVVVFCKVAKFCMVYLGSRSFHPHAASLAVCMFT